MKEFVVYTALRLLLLVATFAVVAGVWLLVAGEFPWFPVLLISVIVSGISSYFVLNRPRQAFASRVDARATAAVERMRAREDAREDRS